MSHRSVHAVSTNPPRSISCFTASVVRMYVARKCWRSSPAARIGWSNASIRDSRSSIGAIGR
jgi:hypothetical protein